MHPQRVTLGCGFCAGSIVVPHFLQNEAGPAATVTGAQYRVLSIEFFLIKLDVVSTRQEKYLLNSEHFYTRPVLSIFYQPFVSKFNKYLR